MENHTAWLWLLAGVALTAAAIFILKRIRRQQTLQGVFSMGPVPDEEADSHFTLNLEADSPEETQIPLSSSVEPRAAENPLMVLSVMARPGTRFASYELLQAISAAGLQFGEMNIFHYLYPETGYGNKLFSMASAEEPGEFNLDNMGEFSCPGLMLFMDLSKVPDPWAAFSIMLEKAEQLSEDLDGQLCADPKTPWSAEVESACHHRIMEYARNHPVL